MLSRFLKLRPAICTFFRLTEATDIEILSEDEWDMATKIKTILQPWYFVQNFLEGQEYVTLSSVPQLISALRENAHENFVLEFDGEFVNERYLNAPLKLLRENLRKYLNHYFFQFHEIVMIAALLDPRYKSLSFVTEEERTRTYDKAKDIFRKLDSSFGRSRRTSSDESRLRENNQEYATELTQLQSLGPRVHKGISALAIARQIVSQPHSAQSSQQRITRTELEQYLQEPDIVEGGEGQVTDENTSVQSKIIVNHFDLLEWWKNNQTKFPILSKMAKQYHAIPASSAPIERVFSISTRVVTNSRTNLTPDSLEQLMMLKVNGFD